MAYRGRHHGVPLVQSMYCLHRHRPVCLPPLPPTLPEVANQTHRLASLLALFLDVQVHRKSTQLGQYNAMHETDVKHSVPIISRPIPQYEPFSSQRAGFASGDLGDQMPYKVQESIEVQHFGYSKPTEQTRYDPVHGMS